MTDELTAKIVKAYRHSRSIEPKEFKSKHWDVFSDEYLDFISKPENWDKFRRNGITCGYDDSFDRSTEIGGLMSRSLAQKYIGKIEYPRYNTERYKKGTQALYSVLEKTNTPRFDELIQDDIGSPSVIDIDGMPINYNTLSSAYYAAMVWQVIKDLELPDSPNVVEIGGGYGALSSMIKMLLPKAKITIFDLPEANSAQTYYLTRRLGKCGTILERDEEINSIPGFQIVKYKKPVDLFINIRSMQEMNWKTIHFYFDHIHRLTRKGGAFFCANRYTKNSGDESPIEIAKYPFNRKWDIKSRQGQIQSHICEVLATRTI